MRLVPLPAFEDNYVWLLHDGQRALVVDPGDSKPVLAEIERLGLEIETILVTHHHADHVGGVPAVREATGARVVGPAFETIPEPAERVTGGDMVRALGIDWRVIDVPGHTAGHVAFFGADAPGGPILFCGDTLFSGGCGRLFEGTPAQMMASLDRLADLPGETRVCCAHEYTLGNLAFAAAVEPGNLDLIHYRRRCQQLRADDVPTLPSAIGQERLINPFLRSRLPAVAQAVHLARGTDPGDEIAVFAALREWKNNFR